MPYKVSTKGISEVTDLLKQMGDGAQGAAARGLYKGAGVVAKELRKQTKAVKTSDFKYAKGGQKRMPSPEEKQILEDAGIGFAKFDKSDDEVNTSVGFNASGYMSVNWNHMSSRARTNYKAVSLYGRGENNRSSKLKALGVGKGAQNQKPIGVIANAVNSGTSFMQKQPFVRKAVAASRRAAEDAIKESIENDLLQQSGRN